MQLPGMTLILAAATMLTGCSSLVSLNEFVTAKDATAEPRLAGVWTNSDGSETYIVKLEESVYSIIYLDKNSAPLKLEARMMQAGEATLLDVYPKEESAFHQPVHTAMRVWLDGDSMRIAFLESDWLRKRAAAGLPSQVVDVEGRAVITAAGPAVRVFLAQYGAGAEAYKEVAALKRVL